MSRTFGLTFDYLCPFARNVAEHVVLALRGGANLEVDFVPFSLTQNNRADDETDVWGLDDPSAEAGILALQAGLAVRDHSPDRFLDTHIELFRARHDRGEDIRDRAVVRGALERAGDLDVDAILAIVDDGEPLDTLRKEHEAAVTDHAVFGVPTFIGQQRAVFVRLMRRPDGDAELAIRTVDRVLDLVDGWSDLNEFKQTVVPR